MPESLNPSIRSNYFISKYSALQNGNEKRQPEAAIGTATRSGKKQINKEKTCGEQVNG
ncbi:MAG: hypothetical protein ACLQVJ_29630 [Syntrophobacteraceae bacterium]